MLLRSAAGPAGGPSGRSNGPGRPSSPRSASPKNGGPWILLCLRRSDWACYSCPHSTEHVQWPTAPMACAHHPPQPPPAPFHPSPTPPHQTPGPRVSGPARRTSQDASAPRSWVSSSATRRYARRRPQAAFAPSRPAPMRATRRRLQSTSAAFFSAPGTRPPAALDAGTAWGSRRKTTFLPLLRPPSPPTLPLLPPLLLPTASPPLPFLPSPRLSPRLGPGHAASPPHSATLMALDRRRARRSSSTRSSVPRRASRRRRRGRASGFPRSAHRASRDARDTHPGP